MSYLYKRCLECSTYFQETNGNNNETTSCAECSFKKTVTLYSIDEKLKQYDESPKYTSY